MSPFLKKMKIATTAMLAACKSSESSSYYDHRGHHYLQMPLFLQRMKIATIAMLAACKLSESSSHYGHRGHHDLQMPLFLQRIKIATTAMLAGINRQVQASITVTTATTSKCLSFFREDENEPQQPSPKRPHPFDLLADDGQSKKKCASFEISGSFLTICIHRTYSY
jgi:hypothetical protein